MPGHDLTRFYALLPLLTALAALEPAGANAVLTALGILAAFHQLR
ncbi:hypothetical protein OIE75_40925 (plasmid) [Streptomyces sp. NBC_01723]|nr:hypothetical protein [Streptomyces sp. NBC_01723]